MAQNENTGLEKADNSAGASGRATRALSTELQVPDNHETSQPSLYTAQVVPNASGTHQVD